MTNYKVAMIITDSFHNDIEGKDYKYGSPTMIDDKSKPIILYYFLDDYERVWDEGKPISYDNEELKNNASVSEIDYTDKVLLINLFNYESLEDTLLKFEVGKETSVPDVVDENDHAKEYKFTPTKIAVANGIKKDTAVFNEIVSSVWEGYYSKQQEGGKLPKVAENVQNAESYKKCAECSDSVFGLEEEICFECSSFGAETFEADPEYEGLNYHGDLPFKEMDKIYKEIRKERKYNMQHPKDGSKVPLSRRKGWELIDDELLTDSPPHLIIDALYEDKRGNSNTFYTIPFHFDLTHYTSPFKINPNDKNDYRWDYYNFNFDPVNPRGYVSLIIGDGNEEGRIISSHTFKEMNAETFGAETFENHNPKCIYMTNPKEASWVGFPFIEGKGQTDCYDLGYDMCESCSYYYIKNDSQEAESFEPNAQLSNNVFIITCRCEDYSEYRELDVAGFGSLTEARKKFNLLFKIEKEQDYADETIAEAKDSMSWGEYWGIMSFNNGGMIYELREVIIGDKGDFYFDAETFEAGSYTKYSALIGSSEGHILQEVNDKIWAAKYKNLGYNSYNDLGYEWDTDDNEDLEVTVYVASSNEVLETIVYTTADLEKIIDPRYLITFCPMCNERLLGDETCQDCLEEGEIK